MLDGWRLMTAVNNNDMETTEGRKWIVERQQAKEREVVVWETLEEALQGEKEWL